MKKVRLILEYDGNAYCGWQYQKNGISVQETLAQGIERISGAYIVPDGAGRTDAGVHALGQVACFLSDSSIPPERFAPALNSVLPKTVSVVCSDEVPLDFHPRKSASAKLYSYFILNRPCRSAMLDGRVWHVPGKLDFGLLEEAARLFLGENDFQAFCASGHSVKSFSRTIWKCEWTDEGKGILRLDVLGNGFLYNMVRIMTGTMIEAAMHKRTVQSIEDAIRSKDRKKAGITAPASGLCMMKVYYDNEVGTKIKY